MFGLSAKQKAIMAYLYGLKDTPEVPPDPRLSESLVSANLGVTQEDVKKETNNLMKKGYLGYVIMVNDTYFHLTPLGIREMEKTVEKKTDVEVSSERVGARKEKRETY